MNSLKIVSLSLLLSIPFFAIAQKEENEREEAGVESLPSEHFYQQRAYPDENLDLKAYLNAFQKASLQDEARSGAQPGFDVPWTLQGPTNIRGRVNAIAIHPTNPDIALIGFATGGLWRTTNNGTTWTSVFDKQTVVSIGDIAFAPSDPNIVFVGTGDPNVTGYPFIGNGVYKSTDAGMTWKNVGLAETRIISKIVVHPTDPNIVYVGAMGLPFERNEDRGLYKTTDGGAIWNKIYYFSNQAGVIDIAMNPQNPQQLFIAGWDRIRNNKETIINGPNSRIVKTNDGGGFWTTQFVGLPTTNNGRIGLAFSPSNISTVYAMYSDENANMKGIYKTLNAGTSWKNVVTNTNFAQQVMGGMAWYFGKIHVTATEIYVLGVDLWRSKDDGIIWDNLSEGTDAHVDMHEIVLRGNTIYLGGDGGVFTTKDDGATWQDFERIPSTSFYKVTTSPFQKGLYYAGAQDHGTLVGNKSGISTWKNIQRGDGFRASFTPNNPSRIFTETQTGNLWISKDSAKTFQLATFGIQGTDRMAWDTPYFISKINSNSMFMGTNKVYKNTNLDNPLWNVLSADLTNGNIFGPQFHVITCLDESKKDSNRLYVGTSDGKLWTNPTYIANWKDISTGLPNRYVTSVHTSPTDTNAVFVTHSGYKDNVFTPHVHKSINGGLDWTPINGNLPLLAINDLFVLPNNADSIIFAATDAGIYATKNSGIFWQRLGSNMPYVPIYDIEWDKENNLLVAATHGRAIMSYPIDSVTYKAPLPVPLLTISGKITTFTTPKNIKNVSVSAFFDNKTIVTKTDSLGIFSFENKIPQGAKVIITPTKKEKGSNGLSTVDLLEMQKHILATKKMINSTSIIAADVNRNSTVTTGDIVLIRKLILALQDTFPSGISWRFIPADYKFPNPQNPFLPAFPENITIDTLYSNRTDINFTGIRIGDTNESAKTDLFVPTNTGNKTNEAVIRKNKILEKN